MIRTAMAGQIPVGRASWSVVALTMKIVSRYFISTYTSCKLLCLVYECLADANDKIGVKQMSVKW